jgi:hypothetical protein
MRTICWRRLVLGGMAIVMLANGGCLAAAVVGAGAAAAGGAAGYVYLKGNVPDDFNADLKTTWTATKLALADLRLPVVREDLTEKRGTLETKTGTGSAVTLTLEPRVNKVPSDGPITRVSVRVGFEGDAEFSDRLFSQIAMRLQAAPMIPQQTNATLPAVQRPIITSGIPASNQTGPPPVATTETTEQPPRK